VSEKLATPAAPIVKVAVMSDGRIIIDGRQVTIELVRDEFKKLAERNGRVWYYREAPEREPPPQAKEVMQAIIESRLPVRLSSRPDYSDSIAPGGQPTLK